MTTPEAWQALDERLRVVEAALAGLAGGTDGADGADSAAETPPGQDSPDTFWIVQGLRDRLPADHGGVAFAGTVHTGSGQVEWQYGRTTEDLLEADEATLALSSDRLSAIGHPVRLRLLIAILDGQTRAAALAALEGMGTTGQVYHHLRTLTAAGWLTSVRRGELQVPPERIVPLLVALAVAR